jgi:hypothetical protein
MDSSSETPLRQRRLQSLPGERSSVRKLASQPPGDGPLFRKRPSVVVVSGEKAASPPMLLILTAHAFCALQPLRP